jgi:hypothetical protein
MPRLLALFALVSACSESARPGDSITIDPPQIDLAPLRCGTDTRVSLTIHNPRPEPVELAIASTLPGVRVDPARTTVAAGDSIAVDVALAAPATPVAATGALVITAGADNLAVPIRIPSAGVAITVDPPVVDFGEAAPGEVVERSVTVSAAGTAPATVTLAAPSSPDYQVTRSAAALTPGGSDTLSIRFTAGSTPQAHPATVALGVDGPLCGAAPVLGLVGRTSDGPVALDRTIVDFGEVRCGSDGSVALQLTNRSDLTTSFAVQVTDPSTWLFATTPLGAAPRGTLAGHASATVDIGHLDLRRVPPGLFLGLVEVALGDGAVVKSVPVRALIQRAIVAPMQRALDFGDVPEGSSVTRSFQIGNSGNLATDVQLFSADGELAISPLQAAMPAGRAQPVEVTFTASAPAGTTFNGTVSLTGQACDRLEAVAIHAHVVSR